MNQRQVISLLLLASFLLCFLEWGGGHSGFIFNLEFEFFRKGKETVASLLHPLIFLPLSGQLILLFASFYSPVNKKLILVAVIMLSSLVLFVLLAGLLSSNSKMIASTFPFIGLSIYFFWKFKTI